MAGRNWIRRGGDAEFRGAVRRAVKERPSRSFADPIASVVRIRNGSGLVPSIVEIAI